MILYVHKSLGKTNLLKYKKIDQRSPEVEDDGGFGEELIAYGLQKTFG